MGPVANRNYRLIPLASVVAPGALTTQLIEYKENASCTVRYLNFTNEGSTDWNASRHGRPGYTMAFFNTTPPPPAREYDWYDQPSFNTDRLITLFAFSQDMPTEKGSPCAGWNCTYTMSFTAPYYNCSETPFLNDSSKVPFNLSNFAPYSKPSPLINEINALWEGRQNYVYQMNLGPGEEEFKTEPNAQSEKFTGQGTFRYEPKIWFAVSVNTTEKNPDPDPRWPFKMVPTAYVCTHQKANYTVKSYWKGDRIESRNVTVEDGVDLLPEGETRVPQPLKDKENNPKHHEYMEFIAYHALGAVVRRYLTGNIRQENGTTQAVTKTKISTAARLIDQARAIPVPDFHHAFEAYYRDAVVSLLQEPFLEIADTINTTCHRSQYQNQFVYQKRGLWIGYSLAIAAAFVAIIFGCFSIMYNGMTSDISFSKILVTTRNASLDGLVKSYPGVSLGGDPVPSPLEKTRLRFGVLDNWAMREEEASRRAEAMKIGSMNIRQLDQWPKHTAFGLEDEVVMIGQTDVESSSSAIMGLEGLRGDRGEEIELRRRQTVPGSGLGVLPG